MILQIFTVYDSKAEAFLAPFFLKARGQAIRSFTDTCNDPEHAFYKHPSDYTLFALGEYDDAQAAFEIYEAPVGLGVAIEFKITEKDTSP